MIKKRIKIGDIVEIPTQKGLAYAHYLEKRPKWGALIRVLYSLYKERPEDFTKVVNDSDRFIVFFPLQAVVNQQIFEIVGNENVPQDLKKIKLFRASGFIDKNGTILSWWLWDGKKEWEIGKKVKEKYLRLPLQEVWNDTALIERIESDWSPENYV